MAKEITEQQKMLMRRARQAAKAAGKDWSKLSVEERRQFRKEARSGGKSAAANPARQKAMKAAQAAGKNWKDLSAEERRSYLKQAGQRS